MAEDADSQDDKDLFVRGVFIHNIHFICSVELFSTELLNVDQHLKVVREFTWETRANWNNFGIVLGVHAGKLQV